MKKIFLALLNPWALAVPFTLMIILLLPPVLKYKIGIVSREYLTGTCFFFMDLDVDSLTEKVGVAENQLGNASLKLYNPRDGLIEQVNFRHGLTSFPPNVSFADSDHDGFGEIYFFTFSRDSVFLAFTEPLGPEKFTAHERFIDRVGSVGDTIDFTAGSGSYPFKDMNLDGFDDLVFYILARFSISPRQVYVYDIQRDTILRSGSFGNNINELKMADIDRDGFLEVMGDNSTRGNTRDSMRLMYGDSSAWLMAYDHELKFLFDPVEFPSYGVKLDVQPFITEDSGYIAVLYRNLGVAADPPAIILYDAGGKLIRKKIFDVEDGSLISGLMSGESDDYSNLYVVYKNGCLEQYDGHLEKIAVHNVDKAIGGDLYHADLDADGHNEIIFAGSDRNNLVIARNDFSHPVEVILDANVQTPRFSLKTGENGASHLAVQEGGTLFLLDYRLNSLYWTRFGWYVLIFAGIFLFIMLIRKLQQIQIRRRRAAEKELMELQLLTIKNQVDPHFTYNTLNAINSLILKEKKENAYRFATKLSYLMRRVLENSDKITTSLEEELDFIRSYLDLQKIRFRDSFDYQITVDGQVDSVIQVPRHILQTYVENAVKHGLRPLDTGGFLWIMVSKKDGHLLLTVRDNGVGRGVASAHSGESTGKGLGIMRQIFTLYERLYHVAIEQEIVDLQDESGKSAGTEVRIRIPGM